MQEQKTMSFVLTPKLEELLKQWAKEEDRTVSATLRRIIEQEAQRREASRQTLQNVTKQAR